jgi:ATP-binding protein involved in chromosome partitioning
MVTSAEIRQAVAAVKDPELHTSLERLGAVQSVEFDGSRAVIVVRAVVADSPLRSLLVADVSAAAAGVVGVAEADVTLVDMDGAQRRAAVDAIRGSVANSKARVIIVASGKGGVGKSSVTTNLSVALAQAGHKVGVIDADVWGYSIPKMLGTTGVPRVLEEALLPPQAHGVRAVSMDHFVDEDQAVIWRGPMLHKALEQFLGDVLWGEPDFLLLDLPPGTGDVSISLSQFLPNAQAIIVTTPQPTAQRVARRAALMADKVNQEVLGIIENMSWFTGDDAKRYNLFGEGGGAALAAELEVPLLGQIPLVPAMGRAADDGHPVVVAYPDSEAAAAFRSIADQVVERRPRVRTHPELVIN